MHDLTHPQPSVPDYEGRAVIGLDLDGVCADYTAAIRPYAAQHLGVDPDSLPNPTTYNLVKANWGFADGKDYLAAHRAAVEDGLYAKMPIIPGAAEAMQKLSDNGVYIRIVTHRLIMGGQHKRVVADTAAWLDDHRIPYMSLCFTGLKDSIWAHAYIEDSPSNVATLRDRGLHTFVFDQAYNREVAGPRISNWTEGADDVLAYLRSIGQVM